MPKPGIDRIKLYQGGASQLAGRDDVLKLSSNENPFGSPDAAAEAIRAASHGLHRYPSTDHVGLREAIAQAHGLDAQRYITIQFTDEGVGMDQETLAKIFDLKLSHRLFIKKIVYNIYNTLITFFMFLD